MNITITEQDKADISQSQSMYDIIRSKVMRNQHGLFMCPGDLRSAIKRHDLIYDGCEPKDMDSDIHLQPRNDETDTQLFYERDFSAYIMKLRAAYTGSREKWPDEYHSILSAMEVHGIIVSSGGAFDCPDALRVPLENGAVYPNA